MYLGIILIGIIGLHKKEIEAFVNINLLDTRNNSIGRALLSSAEVNMNQNYAVICELVFNYKFFKLLDKKSRFSNHIN